MTPAPDPRRRDRKVLVEKRAAPTLAGNGEPVVTWAPAFTDADGNAVHLWAEKLEGRALERFAAAQRIAQTATVFSFAWAPANTIDPATHRLKYDGRSFEVTGSVEQGRRQGVAVMCEAIAATPGGADVRP